MRRIGRRSCPLTSSSTSHQRRMYSWRHTHAYHATRRPMRTRRQCAGLVPGSRDCGNANACETCRNRIPGSSEVSKGEGVVRIRDTGPGLTEERIGDALTAGFSTKNAFDTLGLFGMGFNIATGKLGRVTRVISARADEDTALQVTLDLPKLIEQGSFGVPAETVAKPTGLSHGTIIEVRGWWPPGDQNSGFIRRLSAMSKNVVREQLARRYARSCGPRVRTRSESRQMVTPIRPSNTPFGQPTDLLSEPGLDGSPQSSSSTRSSDPP